MPPLTPEFFDAIVLQPGNAWHIGDERVATIAFRWAARALLNENAQKNEE